ncbi:MAG: alpha/beta hydrolase [Chloroflexota bacterium]|nr:alpha/beta hydrolase [Chloroflexota bacterium]MDQ5867578.1 alpha/beta hydrolase [Chloroflexota bacterium]
MPYLEHNGTRVYYELRGEGEPILVLPGFTEDTGDLEELVSELAQSYRVIAADLPGSGRSQPIPRQYSPDFYLEDARTMSALLRHLGIEKAHVAGFSDGGEVALLMAVRHPDLVRSLIVWGAAGTLGAGDIAPTLDAIYNMVDDPTEDLQGWSDYIKQQYGEEPGRATMQSWSAASKAILERGGDISLSRAHEIRCPTLIISGELDPFLTPDMTRDLASRIPAATFHIVPDVGHTVHHDRPEWFMQTVLNWLSSEA